MTALLFSTLIGLIGRGGYAAILGLMAAESACIPLPSEVIMPFAGFLAARGVLSVQGAALAGTLGCLLGSVLAYEFGARGGRAWLEHHGRWLLVRPADLAAADRWFARHGDSTVFFARLLPVIRTFIALPAGVARMPRLRFVLYTVAGSYLWCWALAALGARLGAHWERLAPYFHRADLALGLTLGLALGLYLYRHLRR